MSDQEDLGTLADEERTRSLGVARALAPVGWALAAVGYFGPWIAHETAALTLSGVDMGEFVKFLPPVMDGSLEIVRQLFYLPPAAVAFGVAMLACSRRLRYSGLLRVLAVALAIPVCLQLLPPAWSPASLLSAEFRLQAVSMAILWLLLAGTCFWGRLSLRLLAVLSAAVALAAAILSAWQFALAKPAIDSVYSATPSTGWGFYACIAGLAVMALAGALMALQGRELRRSGG